MKCVRAQLDKLERMRRFNEDAWAKRYQYVTEIYVDVRVDALFHLTCVTKFQKNIRVQELSVWQI